LTAELLLNNDGSRTNRRIVRLELPGGTHMGEPEWQRYSATFRRTCPRHWCSLLLGTSGCGHLKLLYGLFLLVVFFLVAEILGAVGVIALPWSASSVGRFWSNQ
jgi:hypothetical protein